jgi:SAM-dependent methyltransferase
MAHEAEATTADPYEAVLYPGFPFAQTHPDRLFTLGVLHGLDPAPPTDCRVLEIGCGDGMNLVSMAAGLPGMSGLGIDRAAAPLARGRRYAEALSLDVELRALDLLEADELGEFDYVIAHGVYAWVPEPVREALLAVAARALAPQGIAFVSYNALPGGHVRRTMRDLLRFHARDTEDPDERVARAREITAVARRWQTRTDPFGVALNHELSRMDRLSDHSLVHDDLGEIWEPVSLADFCARAQAHGLAYLADADLGELWHSRFPEGVEEAIRTLGGGDRVAREMYGDLISGRSFRQTLLCRPDAAASEEPVPDGLSRLWAITEHAPDPLPDGSYASAVDEACVRLSAGDRPEPAGLLEAFRLGLVKFHARPPRHATVLPERPRVPLLARLMAVEGGVVATLDHEGLRTNDPFLLRVIALLDGTRDRAALLEALLASVGREIVVEVEGQPVTDGELMREPFAGRMDAVLGELLETRLILKED